jgi:hypothetical protein
LVGWLAVWLVGCLVDLLVGWFGWLVVWLVGWLAGWLVVWLVGWVNWFGWYLLVDWLARASSPRVRQVRLVDLGATGTVLHFLVNEKSISFSESSLYRRWIDALRLPVC